MPGLRAAVDAAASALSAERRGWKRPSRTWQTWSRRADPTVSPIAAATSCSRPAPVESFDTALGRAAATGVRVAGVVEDQAAFRRRFEPSHPDADKEGYVALPNIDPAEEMVDMVGAARAYQANLTAIGLIRDMVQRALDLGR